VYSPKYVLLEELQRRQSMQRTVYYLNLALVNVLVLLVVVVLEQYCCQHVQTHANTSCTVAIHTALYTLTYRGSSTIFYAV
jgi:fumarate reductase subunit D